VRPGEDHHRLALELGHRRRLRSQPLLRCQRECGLTLEADQVHVLVQAHDDRGALELINLALEVHDRFGAAALPCQRLRLDFDRRAQRDRQPRFVIELAPFEMFFDDAVGA
jgi:hypothetical protein